jgi:PAS domain-containing protein
VPKVRLEFTVNEQDWAGQMRAFRLNRHKRRETIISALFPFVLFGALAVAHTSIVDPLAAILIVSPLAVLPAYVHFIAPRKTAQQRARNESAHAKILFEISDDGVCIKDDYMETLFDWRCFQAALITEGYYFLVSDEKRGAYHFIPRRAFTSEGQERTLNVILEAKLPDVQSKAFGREQGVLNLVMGVSGTASALAFLVAVVLLILRCL